MHRRQTLLFTLGCWSALFAALVHLAGHVAGPLTPANNTERQLAELASTYAFTLLGGTQRTFMDVFEGLSLAFPLFLAMLGAVGLVVAKRGSQDGPLMIATSRLLGVGSLALLVISLTHFFIVPSIAIAAVTVCFLVASVRAPEETTDSLARDP